MRGRRRSKSGAESKPVLPETSTTSLSNKYTHYGIKNEAFECIASFQYIFLRLLNSVRSSARQPSPPVTSRGISLHLKRTQISPHRPETSSPPINRVDKWKKNEVLLHVEFGAGKLLRPTGRSGVSGKAECFMRGFF